MKNKGNKYEIAVAGTGYVGLSNAILLSQYNKVTAVDVIKDRVDLINENKSPIVDKEIIEYLQNKTLDLKATTDGESAYKNADYVIVATPTNYIPEKNYFDTSSVESVIEQVIKVNKDTIIIIKSTVPIGYTERIRKKYHSKNILFSPEFLREGKALYDNLYPSRIIVSADKNNLRSMESARVFANLLAEGAIKRDITILITDFTEAEAVKLFANTYLAVRISYFNELDTYAEARGLNAAQIIEGVCLDPRIGQNYNNPSFGYGGYCLPKDSKQLLAEYGDIPESMIEAVVRSNELRKDFICSKIIERLEMLHKSIVGVYRLVMKAGSDNFRESSIHGIISRLSDNGVSIIIYEPTLPDNSEFGGFRIINDFSKFTEKADVILANRNTQELDDVAYKVYTRDIYQEN